MTAFRIAAKSVLLIGPESTTWITNLILVHLLRVRVVKPPNQNRPIHIQLPDPGLVSSSSTTYLTSLLQSVQVPERRSGRPIPYSIRIDRRSKNPVHVRTSLVDGNSIAGLQHPIYELSTN